MLGAGCSHLEKEFWRERLASAAPTHRLTGSMKFPDGNGPTLHLGGAELLRATRPLDGGDAAELVRVPAGLEETGRDVGVALRRALREAAAAVGVDPAYHGTYAILESPLRPASFSLSVEESRGGFPVPLFAQPGQSAGEILIDNQVVLGAWIHEFFELTLFSTKAPPTVLMDAELEWGLLRWKSLNGTRWYRDGLANYAAHVALASIRRTVTERWPDVDTRPWQSRLFVSLSALSRAGDRLFEWHQFDRDADELYPAAGGFLFLVQREFGSDALRRLAQRIAEIDYPDGAAIEEALTQIIGTTPRALVGALGLDLGLDIADPTCWRPELDVVPGSAAAFAGMQPGDRLLRVDGMEEADLLALECALLDARESGVTVTLHVERRQQPRAVTIDP